MIILIAFLTVGCAKSDDSATQASNKSLWSLWKKDDGRFIDLSSGQFDTYIDLNLYFASGEKCSCDLKFIGAEASGDYLIVNCFYVTGGSGDPGCSTLNHSGTYSKTDTTLSICQPNYPCGEYK